MSCFPPYLGCYPVVNGFQVLNCCNLGNCCYSCSGSYSGCCPGSLGCSGSCSGAYGKCVENLCCIAGCSPCDIFASAIPQVFYTPCGPQIYNRPSKCDPAAFYGLRIQNSNIEICSPCFNGFHVTSNSNYSGDNNGCGCNH